MKTSRCATIAVVLLAGGVWRLNAQTTVDLTRQGKLGTGATVPSQCAVGQVFFKTSAPAGANLYSCTSANVWSVVGLIPLGGDTSGTAPSATVTGLQGRPVSSGSPSDQDALRWNAASGLWAPEAVISVGSATPPATCSSGGLYLRNDTANNFHQLYVCSNTNVWTMASIQAGTASGRPANCLLGQTWLATDTGAMTYCSATGSPGTWSAMLAGPAGPQGPTGANGNTVWNGTAAPSGAMGANGDFYLINPTTAPCLYGPKTSGNWPGTCVSLAGPAGAAGASGNTLLSGIGVPSNGSGTNGDFYVRLDASCLYGPKASGVWPGSCTSLIGPQGATGATGAAGSQGPQGPAGALGGANGQIPYNNNGTAAGSNLSQNTDGSLSANKAFNAPLCTVTLSATPAFDASQCNAFGLTLGGTTVTSSTLLNAKAGQSLTFTIVQDATGGRSFIWPTNLLSVCPVNPAAHTSTAVTAVFDGINANATSCTTSDVATLIAGPTRSAPGTPSTGLACWFDSSANTLLCKDPGGNVYAATKTVGGATSGQFVTYIDASGVQHTAPGGGSVFTGSTATAPTFSATPTFSLADTGVKSPVLVEPGVMSASVTAVTFTNLSGGAKFSIRWTQAASGGPYTVTYGASVANTPCAISATASAWTEHFFEVDPSGTTVTSVGCTTSDTLVDLSADTLKIPTSAGFTSSSSSMLGYDSTANLPIGWFGSSMAFVGLAATQSLTNKTLDGVTPTTMGYLDATSSIQTQLNGKLATIGMFSAPPWLHFSGDGSEGAVNCSGSIAAGEHWVSSFTVSVGNTCTVSTAYVGLIIRSTGACTIAGTLTNTGGYSLVNGEFGGAGGGGGGGTAAGSVGAPSAVPMGGYGFGTAGGAGTASGGAGGIGTAWTAISAQYQNLFLANQSGYNAAGGARGGVGGSAGAGTYGNGGSLIVLDCASINFTGSITSNGAAGGNSTANNAGGGGGGGGGFVILAAQTFTANTGSITTNGGAGGSCLSYTGCGAGGPGGAGGYKVFTIQ
jgi:hypothetical protein